jgi:hypothetical protein
VVTFNDSNNTVKYINVKVVKGRNGTVATGYAGGDGSSGNPYQIATGSQLAYLASQVNAGNPYSGMYFQLKDDINLRYKEWTPIGIDGSHPFSGTFDGNNHTISKLKLSISRQYVGLFGITTKYGSEIKNTGLLNVSINITGPEPHSYAVASLVAQAGSTKIANCYATGSVTRQICNSACVGGLIGATVWDGELIKISDCYSTCNVVGYGGSIGGLVGFCERTSTTNCYATGNVVGSSDNSINYYIGGLVGFSRYGTISNCYAAGHVMEGPSTVSLSTGGVIGLTYHDELINVYWNSSVNSKGTGYSSDSGDSIPKTSMEMKTADFASTLTNNSIAAGYAKRWKYISTENEGYPVFDKPMLTELSVNNAVAPSATIHFVSDAAGTYYYLIFDGEVAAPSMAAIEEQGAAVAKGTGAATAGANSVDVIGLTGSEKYKAYIIVEDASGSMSSVAMIPVDFLIFNSGTAVSFSENATGAAYTATATAGSGGGTVTYSIDGGADQEKFAIDSSTGVLTFVSLPDYENPGDADVNNEYNVVIKAADNNGSVLQSVVITVVKAAVITGILPDTGTSADDGITNNNAPTVKGTAEAGSTVSVQCTSGAEMTGIVTTEEDGQWSYAIETPLSDGTYSFTATATDAEGITGSASNSYSFTIDTQISVPSTPDLDAESDSGFSSTAKFDNLTNVTTPTLNGTAEEGSLVTLYNGETAIATGYVIDGKWSITTPELAEGKYNLTARAADAAGNTSTASDALEVRIDTTAPVKPVINGISEDTGVSDCDNLTKANTLVVSITEPNFITVVVAVDGNYIMAYACLYETRLTDIGTLSEGVHTITATAKDEAGNENNDAAVLSFTVDTTAPEAELTSPLGESVSVSDSSIVLGFSETVTAVANKKVIVSDGTNTYTYTIKESDNYISETGSDCITTIPVSSFLNGATQLTLKHATNYSVAVEGAYTDVAGNQIVQNNNLGSFTTEEIPEASATVVNIAAIQGVTAPVKGAVPVETITETDQYTGIVEWNPVDNPFEANIAYTAILLWWQKTDIL